MSECLRTPFELARPVRTFPSFRGQRNWPGLWWAATMRAHVGYESWLERDHAMLLDFDSQIRPRRYARLGGWQHDRFLRTRTNNLLGLAWAVGAGG